MNKITKKTSKKAFEQLLKKIRATEGELPTLEEITAEVEAVRAARYNPK
jgi:hypothetical protein